MQPVTIDEIKSIAEYEVERETFRPQVMAIKDRRRIRVGDHLTFLFENRETVRYQIQEMMRIERIVKRHDIEHEIATYNELIPARNGLSASLLIEYETPELRAVWLQALLGLEHHIWFQIGNHAPVRARFDDRQISTDRISSVQYISFEFPAEQVGDFATGARIIADHPHYSYRHELTAAQLEELAQDFR